MHEYNVSGSHNPKVYYYLVLLSIALSTLITNLITEINTILKISISISISSAAIYTFLYFLFDRVIWKMPILGIPDLSGEYIVQGVSFKYGKCEKRDWEGKIHIEQTWKKILITLDTESSQSVSISMTGNIVILKGRGYRLDYLYSNEPSPKFSELHSHHGHCQIIIGIDKKSGEGRYFTNQERCSYGSMKLLRSNHEIR